MDKNSIINFLEENQVSDIEEIQYKEGFTVLRFYYDFDKDEMDAAKAYANDECDEPADSDEWYDDFYFPYLNEIAIDNVGEIIEECMDKFQVESQYVSYTADKENSDFSEFICVFFKKGADVDIDEVMDELEL